jgi:MerR family redox-sensitive transcriptional activator SoxR
MLVVEVNFKSRKMCEVRTTDLLTVSEVAERSGFAPSALRFYERLGLVHATRTTGNQRRYERNVLRRLAFIRAARNVGLSRDEVAAALDTLPERRPPTRADWARLSRGWRQRLDDQIAAMQRLRDGLDSCIGCGCLSLKTCAVQNPGDVAQVRGPGAAYLPAPLREPASAR